MINYLAVEGQPLLTDLIVEGSSSSELVRITQTGAGNALVVEDAANPDSTPFIVDFAGRVGIGKTPSTKLDVDGSAAFNGETTITGNTLIRQALNQDAISIRGRAGGSSGYNVILTTGTLTGSATATFAGVNGTVITTGNLTDITSIGTLSALTITGNLTVDTNTLFVDATNNRVGVGTLNPSTALDVVGTVTATTFNGNADTATTSTGATGVGYMGLPQNGTLTGNASVAASDAGKHIYSTATRTLTIPANVSLALPIGTTITFIAGSGATVNIAITSDTMYLAGNGAVGSRTLAPFGMATAVKIASTAWIISGNGLT